MQHSMTDARAAKIAAREDREIDALVRTPAGNIAAAAHKAATMARALEADFTDATADPWERRLLRLSRSIRDDLRRLARAAS